MEIYMPHKIGFIGTLSVGKSRIHNWCKREVVDSGCAIIDEAATIYFSTHQVPKEARFSGKVQGEIQSIAIGMELNLIAATQVRGIELCFLDRIALCAAIYVRSSGDIAGSDRLYARMLPLMSTYSRLYLLDPADTPLQQNAIRTEDEAKRNQIHQTFLEFLAEKNIKYELLSGTEKQRKKTVSDYAYQLLMGEVVRDNVFGSPKVELMNRYAARDNAVFKLLGNVGESMYLGELKEPTPSIPEKIRYHMEQLMFDLLRSSEPFIRGEKEIPIMPSISAHPEALQLLLNQCGVNGIIRDVLSDFPTNIDGLYLRSRPHEKRLTSQLSFVLTELTLDS